MARPIQISVNGNFKKVGEKRFDLDCDDAIIIFSKINGAFLGNTEAEKAVLTREVGAWVGGFDDEPGLYDRLSQAVLQIFSSYVDEKISNYNLINFIQFLINNSNLRDKATIRVSENLISNTAKGGLS